MLQVGAALFNYLELRIKKKRYWIQKVFYISIHPLLQKVTALIQHNTRCTLEICSKLLFNLQMEYFCCCYNSTILAISLFPAFFLDYWNLQDGTGVPKRRRTITNLRHVTS